MSKFKAGDKVRYVGENNFDVDMTIGNEYIVSEYKGEDFRPLFVIDDEGESQGFYTGQFELVEDECEVSDGDIIEKDGKKYVVRLEERRREPLIYETAFNFQRDSVGQVIAIRLDERISDEIEPYVENEVIKFRWKK